MQSRRHFLRQFALGSASLLLADRILANPYRPLPPLPFPVEPVRIRGAVRNVGKGIANVVVTDGRDAVRTGADGTFELRSTSHQEFVHISLPAGHEIPQHPTGTAHFYKSITPNADGEMSAVFDLTKSPLSDRKHAFFQMADPQMLDEEDVLRFQRETAPDVRAVAAGLGETPLFGVSCGDIMFDRLQHYPGYEQGVRLMGIPCFQVVGNHDVEVQTKTDETSMATFKRLFGPTFYSFNRGDIHYVVMDDVFWFGGYIGYLDQTQLDWLKADLSFVEKGTTLVVFMHIPIYCEQHKREGKRSPENSLVVTNRQLLYRILEPYKSYIICGHMHESEYLQDGGTDIHINGAVCGAWWAANVCADGTPNGYSLYEVNGSELRWRYKATGKPIDFQMALHRLDSGEVAANIWGANSRWTVRWHEDGMQKGFMERRLAKDPETVRLYAGPELPKKHKWVEPAPTDHLFFAKPSSGAKEVIVEARDDWGRTFTGRIKL